jgi:muconolactone D-isomerase
MLFHVRMNVRIPHDLNPERLADLSSKEHERAKELQSAAELHEILNSLPLYPFMEIEAAALCHHPGSLELNP